jgi:DNA-binding HxlR family transcriptional regulator
VNNVPGRARQTVSMTDDRVSLDACPNLTFAFEILGKRWSALILDLLGSRPARFSEILRAVPGLSDKMLAERLAELMDHGLITRSVEDVSVTYALTGNGRELAPALDAIRRWAVERKVRGNIE